MAKMKFRESSRSHFQPILHSFPRKPQTLQRKKIGKNVRITPYINYVFCIINYVSALLSSKTMANSLEYCKNTPVMNTYCINKRGFQFLSFFLSLSTPLYLFFPLPFTDHSLQCPRFLFSFRVFRFSGKF